VAGLRPSARRYRPPSSPGASSLPETSSGAVSVPRLNTDPVWSLRPWPLNINLHGTVVDLPELCATDWLMYLLRPVPDLDGLIIDYLPELEDLVMAERITLEQIYEDCLTVIAAVAARPWWVALRLIGVATRSWDVLGPKMMFHGVDPNIVSLAAWLDALLIITLENMDPKDTTMFTMRLEAVPVVEKANQPELEMDKGAFLSLMN
jgi:hypothetical protein